MGAVYEAWQQKLDRSVALKVLAQSLGNDEKYIVRFRREARAAARLTHHNIVQVYDVGVEGEQHYIVMDYIQGKDLSQVIKEGKLWPREGSVR